MDFSTTRTKVYVISFITVSMESPMSCLAQPVSYSTRLRELASDRNKLLLMPKSVKSKRRKVRKRNISNFFWGKKIIITHFLYSGH